MDISAESEMYEYSTEYIILDDEHCSNMELGTSNINSQTYNTNNPENTKDVCNLSDISVSSADTYTPKQLYTTKYLTSIEIGNWEPFLIEDKLVISGNVAGSVQTDRICKQRISSLIFIDDNNVTCCIVGPMKPENEVPDVIRNQFKYTYKINKNGEKIYKDGIPENWTKLCMIWKLYMDSVIKSKFDWNFHFDYLSYRPLHQINIHHENGKTNNNKPKTKIRKKFEKYKRMLEQEYIRDSINDDSESDTNRRTNRFKKKKLNNHQENDESTKLNGKTLLNKRTSCYINNQIPFGVSSINSNISMNNTIGCQTDVTLIETSKDDLMQFDDKNESTNVVILSPLKYYKCKNNFKTTTENCAINNLYEKPKIIETNKILKDLTNNTDTFDDSEKEFYENIIANSTIVEAKNNCCKKINYICSKALEKLSNSTPQNSDKSNEDNLDIIDIDLYSKTILNDESPTTNLSVSAVQESEKSSKTMKNNIEKINDTPQKQMYELRSPKRYVVENQIQEMKRKKLEKNTVNNENLETLNSIKCSLRKRKRLNYREMLFDRISLPENSVIINGKICEKKPSPKIQNQLKIDEKLYKKCYVILMRENLETKKNTATNSTIIEKENVSIETPEHVFKIPLTPIIKKTTNTSNISKLSKSLVIPNCAVKTKKKLSLPGNPMEMWKMFNCKNKIDEPLSPFSMLTDTSSESSDKKRRKLFSPDNWMQSDGCLKTLAQNPFYTNNCRFSIRFDDIDKSLDSEFSDSNKN